MLNTTHFLLPPTSVSFPFSARLFLLLTQFRCISHCHDADSSIIGIRSNYNVNDALVKPSTNLNNLSPLTVATSNSMASNQAIAQATTSEPQHANQTKMLPDAAHRDKPPQKCVETVNVHVANDAADVTNGAALKSTPDPLPTITVTPTDDSDTSIDGMLDRISHDLDYLLNRVADIPPPPQPPTATIPIHKTLVHDVIIEEEPDDL